ncbi:MAG TPA: energy transducer TonB [Candidatus Sulfotelmatobacter sp.]|jgi:TonB family protein|nr:energy transducer TonB [Candidatus Sulfotelmatobacter sp.]
MKSLMRQGAVLGVFFAATLLLYPQRSWSQDVVEASRKVLIKTQPVYPPLARSMNVHGTVKLEALVEPNGTVKSVTVKGGPPLFAQSAVTAVDHWKFEPASRETKEQIEIRFE